MIAHLNGNLARVATDYIVIDVNGVGYKVYMPLASIAKLPSSEQKISALITTIVREDSITLYGFEDEPQQALFDLLLSVSGVGPKAALNILSFLSVEQIINSISHDNILELNRVPGIGNKTAQRIVLELKEKISTYAWAKSSSKAVSAEARSIDDAIEGLVALGYSRNDAKSAVDKAKITMKDNQDTGNLVKVALKLLSKN